MITNLYYTTRRNTYYNPIQVLQEFLVYETQYVFNSDNQWLSGSAGAPVNYSAIAVRLASRPVIGQLIVLTLTMYGHNPYAYSVAAGGWGGLPPIVGQFQSAYTKFNLACVGGQINQPGTAAEASYQSSIWYRTVDIYDLNEWDAGRGYALYFQNGGAAFTGSATLTHLSHGQYWGTPLDSTLSWSSGSGAYENSSPFGGTGVSSLIAGDPTGVDVAAGGVVIASIGAERANSNFSSFAQPTVNNGFSIVTSQQFLTAGTLGTSTARRNYTTAETNQNTTFTFTGIGNWHLASSIAAFNP